MTRVPQRILLATDLSARSDRAQDRAVSLMKQYDSELLALHVLESAKRIRAVRRDRFSPSFSPKEKHIERAKRELLGSLRHPGYRVRARIEEGDPPDAILRVAGEEKCDLIVTGVARNEMFGRFRLGKTVDRLLRTSKVPMLIVTDRVSAPYRNIVVASDFSDVSRQALEAAAALFPDQKLTVLHAHAAPGSYAVDNLERYTEHMREVAHREYTAFLRTVDLPPDDLARISVLIEWGDLAQLLQDLVQRHAIDLVVLGSRIRGVLPDAFIGSVARRVVAALPCDALVVRGT